VIKRSRRRLNSKLPSSPTHTSAEWGFRRRLVLLCPKAGHQIGTVRDDTAGATLSGQVRFSGTDANPQLTIHWICTRCDKESARVGDLARTGRPRLHEGRISAAGLLELLAQMSRHGPDRARVQLDPARIAALTARVASGEQLRAVQVAEEARVERHRGMTRARSTDEPTAPT
jgi:hypothetical protein